MSVMKSMFVVQRENGDKVLSRCCLVVVFVQTNAHHLHFTQRMMLENDTRKAGEDNDILLQRKSLVCLR